MKKEMKLREDLLRRDTVVKALDLQISRIGKEKSKLIAENGLQMSHLCPKRYEKAIKKMREHIEEQYLGLCNSNLVQVQCMLYERRYKTATVLPNRDATGP